MNEEFFVSDMHLDVLKEVGNIGAAHAATSLSQMVDRKIEMHVPSVKLVYFSMITINKVVRVGIAAMNIVKYPETIRTSGLGSCVGVVLYALMEMLKAEGARPMFLKAKIAGGAQMFQFGSSDAIRIGPRNVEAVKAELKRLSIPILAEETGGTSGGTIEFNPSTSKLSIRTVNKGTIEV